MSRRISRPIRIGTVTVGGGAPIVVQSMTKTDTRDVASTVAQIGELEGCGCELVRVAVPDREAAEAISAIKRGISIPLVADIHFDYRLALAALKAGVDGLRLNPGNIGDPAQVAEVAGVAKERSVPLRIGVNAGSLPTSTQQKSVVEAMTKAALEQVWLLESLGFDLIKLSLKSFDVPTTVEANRLIAEKVPYPLHLGITEAGLPTTGVIRSTVGITTLLNLGLGDTIRVSLTTGDPCREVAAAYEILQSLELREKPTPTLVSCPSFGRTGVDIVGLAEAVEKHLGGVKKFIKVAVMGCVVNGPGEAKEADVGLACGRGRGVIFKRGEVVRWVEENDFLAALMAEVKSL